VNRWINLGLLVAVIILTAMITGCSAFMPDEATPFSPPESYRRVWIAAMACTGEIGDMDRITFYKMPGHDFKHPANDHAVGAGYRDRIFIAEASLDHPMVVKHEMIHALIGAGHPRVPFEAPCRATWETWDRTEERLEL
jgi:hypothetical protein